jgi:hypothetical protein
MSFPEAPKLKDFKKDPFLQEDWKICPTCRAGRGEVVEIVVVDEDGQETSRYPKTITCTRCGSSGLVPKYPGLQ